jgi:hypothetical protein
MQDSLEPRPPGLFRTVESLKTSLCLKLCPRAQLLGDFGAYAMWSMGKAASLAATCRRDQMNYLRLIPPDH